MKEGDRGPRSIVDRSAGRYPAAPFRYDPAGPPVSGRCPSRHPGTDGGHGGIRLWDVELGNTSWGFQEILARKKGHTSFLDRLRGKNFCNGLIRAFDFR